MILESKDYHLGVFLWYIIEQLLRIEKAAECSVLSLNKHL